MTVGTEGRAAVFADRDEAAAGSLPSLSVVVPTTRGGSDLEACLVSLAADHYPNRDVVVVDNGSGDPALVRLPERFAGVRVLRNEEIRGFAVATNQGIAASRGSLVLMLNDDAELELGALRAMVEALVGHPSWGACQAKLLVMNDPTLVDTAGSFLTATGFLIHRGLFEPEERFAESDEIFAAKGAALLVRRSALTEVGLLDPDFFAYLEETDLCWRLWLAGWEVGFAAGARIRHKIGGTASALPLPFVQYHSFKNRICMLLKNLGVGRLAWMLPYHLALCLGLAGWYALHREVALGGAILRAIGWNASHLSLTVEKRHAIQARRSISDRELMPRITRRTPLRKLVSYAGAVAPQKPGSAETREA